MLNSTTTDQSMVKLLRGLLPKKVQIDHFFLIRSPWCQTHYISWWPFSVHEGGSRNTINHVHGKKIISSFFFFFPSVECKQKFRERNTTALQIIKQKSLKAMIFHLGQCRAFPIYWWAFFEYPGSTATLWDPFCFEKKNNNNQWNPYPQAFNSYLDVLSSIVQKDMKTLFSDILYPSSGCVPYLNLEMFTPEPRSTS